MEQRRKKALEALVEVSRRDPDVLAVIVFGSTARGEDTARSDVDVCVVLMPQGQTFERLALSNKRIEYLASFDLDIQIFQQLPLYMRSRVFKDGQIVFARDEDLLYELALRFALEFEDFKPVYHEYLEHVAND